mmetsp:Transcript_23706/g.49393  ORF Transcript_23706/g.49393 Transcript_23706/m.49393 type:complete len:283 (+) Transcript_23706:41-889(+)
MRWLLFTILTISGLLINAEVEYKGYRITAYMGDQCLPGNRSLFNRTAFEKIDTTLGKDPHQNVGNPIEAQNNICSKYANRGLNIDDDPHSKGLNYWINGHCLNGTIVYEMFYDDKCTVGLDPTKSIRDKYTLPAVAHHNACNTKEVVIFEDQPPINMSIGYECLEWDDPSFATPCREDICMDQDFDCEEEMGDIVDRGCMMENIYAPNSLYEKRYKCCHIVPDNTGTVVLIIILGSVIWVSCGTVIAIKCMQLSEEHKRNQIGPEDDEWRSGKERWKRDDNR